MRAIDPSKRIYIQEPTRDLGQVNDSRIRLDSPLILANHAEISAWNGAASDSNLFAINGVEVDSGAAPEVNVQAGFRTLQSVERQGEVLPKTRPDGSPFIMAFLSRARCGFCRDARSKKERKLQYRAVAEAAAKNGQIAKISLFDAGNRTSWVRGDYECIYELRQEGVPILLEGVVSVSDDQKLTPAAFRKRVRGFLELDAEIRKSMGIEQSAMHSFALKNTDGRLRGDDVSFARGNTAEYGKIQIEEIERIHESSGGGPTEIRFHTHQIGYANDSAEAWLNNYLKMPTSHVQSACIDMHPGSTDFPDSLIVINSLREKRGWNASLSPHQQRIGARKNRLLDKAAAPYRGAAIYTPTTQEWQRFHCAPAAWPSGVRLSALKHVRSLKAQVSADDETINSTAIRVWGLLNAACKRLLGGTYSITPVANYHNQSAGDILGKLVDEGFVRELIELEVDPLLIPDEMWDGIAFKNLEAIQQVLTAGYMTRADLDVQLHPEVFAHLCRVRTAAVLPEDQDKSFFSDYYILGMDYARLREELLANVTDENAARQIFEEVRMNLPDPLIERFIQKYIGFDTSPANAEPSEFLPKAKILIAQLSGDDPSLQRALEFAAIVGGVQIDPKRHLRHLAVMPSSTHNNILWWEGVGAYNPHEQHIRNIFKQEDVDNYEALFEKNPAAATAAAMYYIKHVRECRHDFGLGDALFHNPRLSRQTAPLRDHYQREVLGILVPQNRWKPQPVLDNAAA